MGEPMLAPLARFVAQYSFADQPPKDASRLFATMIDWSSALLSGIGHPYNERYLKALASLPGETGPASIVGASGSHPVANAAAANAAISHFWEVDDAHRESTSHPGITVLPVAMALAQAMPEIGVDVIRGAVVTGYETGLRVGAFLGSQHYAVCHTTATAGSFGAAAAAAHMLGLDAERTLWAFGHAGTQAQGLWQILDDDAGEAKAFHGAIAVRNGIAAAMMARAGLRGATRILEGRRGMLAAWKLTGNDPSWLEPTGDLMIETVTIKNWPTCGQMHSTLDCAVELAREGIDPAAIASVEIEIPKACGDIAGVEAPQTVSAAKFSTSFCVAAVLAGRKPDFRGLQPALLGDAQVRALAEKVKLIINPHFTARFPRERPARVTVTLTDGTQRSIERSFRKGDPEAPWTRDELVERTKNVLALSGQALDSTRLIDWCDGFADPKRGDWTPGGLFSLVSSATTLKAAS